MAKKIETFEDAVQEVQTYPANVLINIAAKVLWESQQRKKEETPKIVITYEQFNRFFKIRGINSEGEKENRGRPSKND